MSVKKFLVLTAAGIASLGAVAAQAGGPDMMAPPAADNSGFYLEADGGWALSDWSTFWAGGFNANPAGNVLTGGSVTNGRTGGTFGVDFGYQFNRYFSAETGWYYLPNVEGTQGVVAPLDGVAQDLKLKSWILYFAGKLAVPVARNITIFGKAGFVWRRLNYSGGAMNNNLVVSILTDADYGDAFFGVGGQYMITDNWSANLQYLYVPAHTPFAFVASEAPSAHLVVAGIGYKFTS